MKTMFRSWRSRASFRAGPERAIDNPRRRTRARFRKAASALAACIVTAGCGGAAKKANASCEIKCFVAGIAGFTLKYGRMPWPDTAAGDVETDCGWPIVDLLAGHDALGLNPEQCVFYDAVESDGGCGGVYIDPETGRRELRDPWGRRYRVVLDLDGDGLVTMPGDGAQVRKRFLMYSSGPDLESPDDDIRSWQ